MAGFQLDPLLGQTLGAMREQQRNKILDEDRRKEEASIQAYRANMAEVQRAQEARAREKANIEREALIAESIRGTQGTQDTILTKEPTEAAKNTLLQGVINDQQSLFDAAEAKYNAETLGITKPTSRQDWMTEALSGELTKNEFVATNPKKYLNEQPKFEDGRNELLKSIDSLERQVAQKSTPDSRLKLENAKRQLAAYEKNMENAEPVSKWNSVLDRDYKNYLYDLRKAAGTGSNIAVRNKEQLPADGILTPEQDAQIKAVDQAYVNEIEGINKLTDMKYQDKILTETTQEVTPGTKGISRIDALLTKMNETKDPILRAAYGQQLQYERIKENTLQEKILTKETIPEWTAKQAYLHKQALEKQGIPQKQMEASSEQYMNGVNLLMDEFSDVNLFGYDNKQVIEHIYGPLVSLFAGRVSPDSIATMLLSHKNDGWFTDTLKSGATLENLTEQIKEQLARKRPN